MKEVKTREVVILKGLPGSGKSTWAKKQSEKPYVKRINKDDLRAMLDNSKHSQSNEKFVLHLRNEILDKAMDRMNSVIIDDTNFNPKHEESIRKWVERVNKNRKERDRYTIRVEFFDVDVFECIRRNEQRSGIAKVPKHVIFNMYNEYIRKEDEPKLGVKDIPKGLIYDRDCNLMKEQDDSLPKALICDLDGTLSIMVDRSPHADSGCINDRLNTPIANILKVYNDLGYKIILFSGRRGEQYEETKRWLALHKIPYEMLIMRAVKDYRGDGIIKREFFDQYVEGKYFIEFVLDDRDRVVDVWRKELGLTCLQVNYGNF